MLNILASVEDNFTYYYLTDTVSRFTIFARRVPVEITEVRITLRNEEKLKAFASITFDDCFVVRGLKVISGSQGYFVSMPSRKRKDGSYQDIAHPINNEMRKKIEDKVLDAFESELSKGGPAPKSQAAGDEDESVDMGDEPEHS
jgi:stage V sporulation protein G